jgi:hypothetical protein
MDLGLTCSVQMAEVFCFEKVVLKYDGGQLMACVDVLGPRLIEATCSFLDLRFRLLM